MHEHLDEKYPNHLQSVKHPCQIGMRNFSIYNEDTEKDHLKYQKTAPIFNLRLHSITDLRAAPLWLQYVHIQNLLTVSERRRIHEKMS